VLKSGEWYTLPSYLLYSYTSRGETFRKEFKSIGEARSLVPENVRTMALTATATKATRKQICQYLGMPKPYLVCESPNRPNIRYSIRMENNVEETFAPLVLRD
jgi:ATP-dependent DNA helicase RecQ